MNDELLKVFQTAITTCKAHPEDKRMMELVEHRILSNITAYDFFHEYVYVILNSGMNNKVAEQIYRQYLSTGSKAIGHPGKREAVVAAQHHFQQWFKKLLEAQDKVAYLDCLPWIGPVTKYHLARNLGIDVAKPDRHLVRLARKFGYGLNVQRMCRELSQLVGLRIGTIDFVLWRYLSETKS